VKAAVKVNGEKLLFNWQMGRDLVQKKAEERWGAGVVEQVSLDLKREFPNEDGFSTSNLWYMKKWYLFYTNHASSEKLQRLIMPKERVSDIQCRKSRLHCIVPVTRKNENLSRVPSSSICQFVLP
jgi:hypothetical protein